MNRLLRVAHVLAIVTLLLATLGLSLPAAQAAGGQPPKPTPAPDATSSPAANPPDQPAGGPIQPPPPPGCGAGLIGVSNVTPQAIPD